MKRTVRELASVEERLSRIAEALPDIERDASAAISRWPADAPIAVTYALEGAQRDAWKLHGLTMQAREMADYIGNLVATLGREGVSAPLDPTTDTIDRIVKASMEMAEACQKMMLDLMQAVADIDLDASGAREMAEGAGALVSIVNSCATIRNSLAAIAVRLEDREDG